MTSNSSISFAQRWWAYQQERVPADCARAIDRCVQFLRCQLLGSLEDGYRDGSFMASASGHVLFCRLSTL